MQTQEIQENGPHQQTSRSDNNESDVPLGNICEIFQNYIFSRRAGVSFVDAFNLIKAPSTYK